MSNELEDKVLVPKVGKEVEFLKAMQDTATIARGTLGWRGQAEMMYDLELTEHLGLDIKGLEKEQALQKIEEYVKQAYLQTIFDFGEWVTKEEADRRRKASKVLYGSKV